MKWFFLVGGIGNMLSIPFHPANVSDGYLVGILSALMIGVFVIANSIDGLKSKRDSKEVVSNG